MKVVSLDMTDGTLVALACDAAQHVSASFKAELMRAGYLGALVRVLGRGAVDGLIELVLSTRGHAKDRRLTPSGDVGSEVREVVCIAPRLPPAHGKAIHQFLSGGA